MATIKVYAKAQNRVALGIVHAYIQMNPSSTLEDLRKAFPNSINPDSGVKENFIKAEEKGTTSDWNGYFKGEDEVVTTGDGMRVAVVSMWTKPSFERIVALADTYGIAANKLDSAEKPIKKPGFWMEKDLDIQAPAVDVEKVKIEEEFARARVEAEKSAAEAHAELERIKAEAEAAKKAAEAEVKRLQEEAEKAKAEAAKAIAETEAAAKKAQNEAKKLDASTACDIEGALPGHFTINDKGDKICFSRGLLQFNPAKYEFRFAENQYDFISSKDNEKIAPNYDGWIDEFGWGTSGYMGCQPTENSKNRDEYGPKRGSLVGSGANYDWGVYNPIVNGGNKENLWRTPSSEEWKYLFSRRPNAEKLRTYCEVNGVNGFMLMPDNFYNNRIRIHIDCTQDEDCITNKFGIKEWEQLELLGVVFIPARQGDEKIRYTKIWSSSGLVTNIECAIALQFYGIGHASATKDCHLGVRLIKDIKELY